MTCPPLTSPCASRTALNAKRYKLRACLRLVGFVLLILAFILPLQLVRLTRQGRSYDLLLQRFYALGAAVWGMRIIQHGDISPIRPLLVVSNHSSYLDIPVLGQAWPLRFTPKSEIRGWPVIGWLCVMAGCVFIDRRREKTSENQIQLRQALQQGLAVSLFPEGSTNDGSGLLPFRSSFFSLAEEFPDLRIQPVSIAYTYCDGTIPDRAGMDRIAWYADMEFVPHLWEFLQTEGVLAHLTFHPPVTIAECGGNRKALAKYCEEVIAQGLAAGRNISYSVS